MTVEQRELPGGRVRAGSELTSLAAVLVAARIAVDAHGRADAAGEDLDA